MQGKTIKTLHLHRGNLGKVSEMRPKCLGKVSEMRPKHLGKVYFSYGIIGKIQCLKLLSSIRYVKYVNLFIAAFA